MNFLISLNLKPVWSKDVNCSFVTGGGCPFPDSSVNQGRERKYCLPGAGIRLKIDIFFFGNFLLENY